MALKHLIEKRVVACDRSKSIAEVAALMESEDVGAIIVLADGKPEGIITDRDIVIRCVAEGKDLKETCAEDIMTKAVETASEDAGLFDVIQLMREKEVRRIPVVDGNGIAIGLLSFGDLFNLLGRELGALSHPLTPANTKGLKRAA